MSGAARRRGGGRGGGQRGGRGRGQDGGRGDLQKALQPHERQFLGDEDRGIAPFDGPASRGTGSAQGSLGRQGSVTPSNIAGPPPPDPSRSRQSSVSETPPQRRPSVGPPGSLDPAKDIGNQKPPSMFDGMKNVDLPASFYNLGSGLPTQFTKRPTFNSTGKEILLPVNSYQVMQFPSRKVHQYDVIMSDGTPKPLKRIVQRKIWNSKVRKQLTGPHAIYDGNKLMWTLNRLSKADESITVDLDVEEGKPPRAGNSFKLQVRWAREVRVDIVTAYLAGRVQYNVEVAEAISFMDHLLRESPSNNPNMVAVKRSFFTRNGQRQDLGGGVEVFRGVYQSIRLAEGAKLVVNLDVSNTCFWKPGGLMNLILAKNKLRDFQDLQRAMRDVNSAKATMRYISKLTVKAEYAGNKYPNKEWKVKCLANTTAVTHRIGWRDPQTGKETGEKIPLLGYFKRKYNLQLKFPDMLLVEMTKKDVVFPMEVLTVLPNQRYSSKLDEYQTASMIKFAVSPPAMRLRSIEDGKGTLAWQQDSLLHEYGLKINNNQILTKARVLPAPGVKFGANKIEQPGTKGRWDLRGKQFLKANSSQLVRWGIGFFTGRIQMDQGALEKFAMDFAKSYRNHGGSVANNKPHIMRLPNDPAEAVMALTNSIQQKFGGEPQLMIFLVQNKESMHYTRIKKSCDCRFGVVSQVMQIAHVQKGSQQYYSNVLMKVNAKLGGCTSQAVPHASSGFKSFGAPTMIIGADVSHASPGSPQASMAAITVSMDLHAGRYAAACQTNGHRVEMISQPNFYNLLGPMATHWSNTVNNGQPPAQIYYIRDGVSESQFAQVISLEVPMIREVMSRVLGGRPFAGKITVIIASKRHHIRAFPKQGDGDQKGNPLPGTLIERDITMPFEWDFYLYSHIALQGTSRPAHYTVILDEATHAPNRLQNMIYEHCYQYMRSTTSVSLHPAVYYAHLASNRARCHENIPASLGPQGGPGYKINQPETESTSTAEPVPLLPLIEKNGVKLSMWYI